jgi:hypothetical protein
MSFIIKLVGGFSGKQKDHYLVGFHADDDADIDSKWDVDKAKAAQFPTQAKANSTRQHFNGTVYRQRLLIIDLNKPAKKKPRKEREHS